MNHRALTRVQPGAWKSERRPLALPEPHHVLVEARQRLDVGGADLHMIERANHFVAALTCGVGGRVLGSATRESMHAHRAPHAGHSTRRAEAGTWGGLPKSSSHFT